eukprot:Skav215830  [mRNA]  locus=scaffold3168:42852:43691:+ [translate_table: standard]
MPWDDAVSRVEHPDMGPAGVTSCPSSLAYQEVQTVFERYVGPITHCNLLEDAASITFLSPDHAQAGGDRRQWTAMMVE